jgi:glycosyltransferase involved in cell wall biosynthesis
MFNAKEFTQKYGLPFHLWERFGSKFYKYFLPYSDVDSAKMKKLNPSITYQITPQGVDESFFKIKHKTPKHILFLSRLEMHQKGIDLLLRAYAKVAKKVGYPLVLAGHGNDTEKIKALITELGLEDKVSFAGSAYGKKKEQLISEAIFVAFPSRHDEISLWALEALASGMPLVGFDLPECKWISDEVSLKAKPFDLDAYAKVLVKATDKKFNAQMRKNARALAKQYSWDKVAGMFDSFIEQVLEKESKLQIQNYKSQINPNI